MMIGGHLLHEEYMKRIKARKQHYINTLTIHGVPKILSAYRGESCFWLFVVLTGISLSLFGATHLIAKYYSYEVRTTLSSHITNENVFPSVTFCDWDLMLDNYYTYCDRTRKDTHPNTTCETIVRGFPAITNVLNTSRGGWSNGIFHVEKCLSWGQKDCANDQYFKSLHKHNHYCFTWNYAGDFYDVYGHTLLKFRVNNTLDINSSRMIAVVHDPEVTELEIMFQIHLQPAKAYQLKIRKTQIHRLKHPFPSNCTDDVIYEKFGSRNIFGGKYTRTTCMESKNYIEMLKKCGDTFDYVKRVMPANILRMYRRNVTAVDAWQCMMEFARRKINVTVSECPVPCHEMELFTLSSFHEHGENRNSNLYVVEIQNERSDSYRVLREKQRYTWEQIAGEVGGFLGLVIGVSFVSLIEILAYVWLLCLEKIIGSIPPFLMSHGEYRI